MSGEPWEPHHTASAEALKRALRDQFPHVAWEGLEPLGSGWEFDAWVTPDGWVFRFPRRREALGQLAREGAVLELVRPVLAPDVAVPRPELRGEPGPHFPWPFAGHRLVAGVAADTPGLPLHPRLPDQLGRTLGRLHAIPEEAARRAGVEPDREGPRAWGREAREVVERVRGLAPEVDRGVRWLLDAPPPPELRGPLRLVHNDLATEHVLLDPETGVLRGILDWTDAALADPALDFVFLQTWRGWPFTERVLRAYSGEVDEGFVSRLLYLGRALSLVWLEEALRRGEDPAGHVRRVGNAFAGPAPG